MDQRRLGLFVLLAVLAAALVPRPGADPVAQAAPSEPCLPDDPYNLAQLASVVSSPAPPTAPVFVNPYLSVQFVRSATIDDGTEEELPRGTTPRGPDEPAEPPPDEAGYEGVPLRIFNTRTQNEFRVTMADTMVREIVECHERTGRTGGSGPAADAALEQPPLFLPWTTRGAAPSGIASLGAAQPLGWSEGDDSRILRTPTTLWPWRTITQSSSWPDGEQSRCTMTLIGPRHLITAAHCLVDFGTNNWKARKLTPARNGPDVEPYGVSQMTPNPPPGEEAWYIVPDPWLDPSTPDNTDKFQWDIGLVLMLDRLGDQTGWMGYGAYGAGDLNKRQHLNRGYPGCQTSYSEKPAGCEIARMYGDTEPCEIGYYHHQGSNGWNRQFAFGCDISRGHSGSPIYHYRYSSYWGTNVPVVTAVVSWHECLTCGEDDLYPNHARRITPWFLGRISWLKEQFP
jgi:V8-like Glu-specific endopeptidase